MGFGAVSLLAGLGCFFTFLSKDELMYLRQKQDAQHQHGAAVAVDAAQPSEKSPLLLNTERDDVGCTSGAATGSGKTSRLPYWIRGPRLIGFALTSMYLVCLTLPVNAYVATIKDQLLWKGASSDEADHIIDIFNIVLPIGSGLSMLFIGPLAQLCERRDLDCVLQFGGFFVTLVMLLLMMWGSLAAQWGVVGLYPITFVWPWVAMPEVRPLFAIGTFPHPPHRARAPVSAALLPREPPEHAAGHHDHWRGVDRVPAVPAGGHGLGGPHAHRARLVRHVQHHHALARPVVRHEPALPGHQPPALSR